MSNFPYDELPIRPLAESALLIELENRIDPALVARVHTLTAALDAAALPGVIDVVPSYRAILLSFDPTVTDLETLTPAIRHLAASAASDAPPPSRTVTIPVVYGGDFGPDLADVAAHTGLSPDEVVARHSAAEYLVAFMGFAPGWGYLLGLPPELETPRLTNPRTRIPPGTVGIGGGQTGVYPSATPGGWRLIGRTPLRLFAPDRPEPFLLRTGDRVHFDPIERRDFERLMADS